MKTVVLTLGVVAGLCSGTAFAQGMMGPKAGSTRDQALAMAAKAFDRMDANHDGKIDNAEVTTMLQARAAKTGKTLNPGRAGKMIGRSDTNGDGVLTLDEYKASAGARFDKLDTNKNGTIDPDEAPGGGGADGGNDG